MGANVNPRLFNARDMEYHATIAADQDLLANDPAQLSANDWHMAELPREIHVLGAGNFVFQTQRSYAAGGADITIALTAADVPFVLKAACVRKIDATTTATKIVVYW